MFDALNVSLAATESITSTLNAVSNAADSAAETAAETGVEFGAFGDALDSVDGDAIDGAVATTSAASAVESFGDEAVGAAAESGALSSSIEDATGSSATLAASLGPLRGRLSTIGAIGAATVPPLVSLGGALGGVAAAGGTAAAGVGAIAAAGLQREAEQMAAASSRFEDASEAREAILSDVGDSINEAIAPLKTAASTEFAMSGLEGLVDLAHVAAEGFAQMDETLLSLGSTYGDAILDTAPDVFDELDSSVRDLAPTLEGVAGAVRDVPDAIAWFREQAVALDDDLASVAGSGVGALAAVGSFGTTLLDAALPPLSVALDVVGFAASLVAMIPMWVYPATAAGVTMAYAYNLYLLSATSASFASWLLSLAVSQLASAVLAISAGAYAIGAVAGVLVGLGTHFGVWSGAIDAVASGWNALVDAIEFSIEVGYAMVSAIGDFLGPVALLLGPLGILIWTIDNLGRILDWGGAMFDWAGGVIDDVASTIVGWSRTAVANIKSLIGFAINAVNAIPGVDLDLGELQSESEVDLSGLKAGDDGGDSGGGSESGGGSSTSTSGGSDDDFSVNLDGANFGDKSKSEVERAIREGVRKANRDTRA